VGKNKLAQWNELGSFDNVIQPRTADISSNDHVIKGRWNELMFKNSNPVILELGCGKGEYSVGLATRFQGNNYIGIDIKGARMWRGAKTSNELKLSNVAFLRTRIEFIKSFFSTDEVDEIWITFPDPHPGRRNANKRLTSPSYLNNYRLFLKNRGLIHLKTDNTELFNYTKTVIENNNLDLVFSTNDLYSDLLAIDTTTSDDNSTSHDAGVDKTSADEIFSIKTHYEKIFLREGLKINYLSFKLDKEKTIQDVFPKAKTE
jgi:tRNA (guanine-N7-)-methyltransferase